MKYYETKQRIILFISILFLCNVLCLTSYAQVPKRINYQGYLQESGIPVTGTKMMGFSIYDANTGGSPVWTETQEVNIYNGIFNVLLGSNVSIDIPEAKPYWLGIQVASEPEMSPRTELTSALYALFVDGLTVKNDNVGIGTENPLVSLHNNGDFITKGPWVDVRAFGATGDGSTDDSPAFTAALNNSFGNRTIVVPAGEYRLDSSIDLLSGTRIVGIGKVIIKGQFLIDNKRDITIENIEFQSKSASFLYCIYVRNASNNILIQDCTFTNRALYADEYTEGILNDHVTFVNCYFDTHGDGNDHIVSVMIRSDNVIFKTCTFRGTNIDGFLKSSNSAGLLVVENCIFSGSVNEEILDAFTSKGPIKFINNHIELANGGVVAYKPGSTQTTVVAWPYQSIISGNTIIHSGSTNNLLYLAGAYTLAWEDSSEATIQSTEISSNDFFLNGNNSPINVRGMNSAKIMNNTIMDKSGNRINAIYLGSNENVVVANNVIRDGYIVVYGTSGPSGVPYGTNLLNGSLTIIGNHILDPHSASACIYINNQNDFDVMINNNLFHITDTSTVKTINIQNCNLGNLMINGNISTCFNGVASTKNGIKLSSVTYNKLIEANNSWQ